MNETKAEYITTRQAAAELGVHAKTVERRIREGCLPVFVDDVDRRMRLIRRADLDQLRTPRLKEAMLASA